MSIADACLVQLTEILPDPLLLTTGSGFNMDRRLCRPVIPSGNALIFRMLTPLMWASPPIPHSERRKGF